jgi:hypothetical protein
MLPWIDQNDAPTNNCLTISTDEVENAPDMKQKEDQEEDEDYKEDLEEDDWPYESFMDIESPTILRNSKQPPRKSNTYHRFTNV